MSPRHHVFSLEEYLSQELHSREKLEYCDGQIFMMAGGSPRHNYLAGRMAFLLNGRLEGGPCVVLPADQRVATADGLYTYADGSVFCEPIALGPEHTALNPTVLVEVLSESTQAYDRGEKLARYQTIPTLQHVVLIEQDGHDVEVWSRTGASWKRTVAVEPEQVVQLPAIGVQITVADIYAGVERIPTD